MLIFLEQANDMNTDLIIAIIGAITTLIVAFLTIKCIEKRKRIAEHMTDRRIEWMYKVREEIANFISITNAIVDIKSMKEKDISIEKEMKLSLNKSVAMLRLLFNFDDNRDKSIIFYIDNIINNLRNDEFSYSIFDNDQLILVKESQVYLKLEWERAKMEVKGYRKGKVTKEMNKKKKKYDKILDDTTKDAKMSTQEIIKNLEKEIYAEK